MKFVILADIHLGPEEFWHGALRRINNDAKLYLANFVVEINNIKPDFVIVLGDLIKDDNLKNDKENVACVMDLLSKLKCPVYYVAGNHDLRNISEFELTELFKQDKLYYSFNYENTHFIVLFSRVIVNKESLVDEQQLEWLKQDLENSKYKSIVFIHHGLADQNLTGNPWFENKPEYALIRNRKKVRDILEKSNKVIAVFNSHLHWDRKDVHNSIPYYTIQSLTENEDDRGIASESYAIVDIKDGELSVKIDGNYPKRL